MKINMLSGVALSAIATVLGPGVPVQAQAQSNNWTGFYLGLNAGGAWGRSKTGMTIDACNFAPGTGYLCDNTGTGAANVPAVQASGSGTIKGSGFTGGVQAGYLWQMDKTVFGVETDFNTFSLKGSRQANATMPAAAGVAAGTAYTVTNSISTHWLYTLRGRLGFLVQPNMLAYATGGLAVTRLDYSFTYSDATPLSGSGSANAIKGGWALGGGLEWAVNNRWSVKGEYLYVDFSAVTATGMAGQTGGYSFGISSAGDLTAHIARVGVNYKF